MVYYSTILVTTSINCDRLIRNSYYLVLLTKTPRRTSATPKNPCEPSCSSRNKYEKIAVFLTKNYEIIEVLTNDVTTIAYRSSIQASVLVKYFTHLRIQDPRNRRWLPSQRQHSAGRSFANSYRYQSLRTQGTCMIKVVKIVQLCSTFNDN
jgi:hypothetical protein